MTLTKEDLQAIRELVMEVTAPLRTEVGFIQFQLEGLKTDIYGLKHDIAGFKCEVAGFKHEMAGIKIDVARLKEQAA